MDHKEYKDIKVLKDLVDLKVLKDGDMELQRVQQVELENS
jgi:hypothetical protein